MYKQKTSRYNFVRVHIYEWKNNKQLFLFCPCEIISKAGLGIQYNEIQYGQGRFPANFVRHTNSYRHMSFLNGKMYTHLCIFIDILHIFISYLHCWSIYRHYIINVNSTFCFSWIRMNHIYTYYQTNYRNIYIEV